MLHSKVHSHLHSHLSSSSSDVAIPMPESISKPAPDNSNCLLKAAPFRKLLLIIPIVNAITDSSQTKLGLMGSPAAFAYPVTILTFIALTGLGKKFTVGGIDESCDIIKHRKMPDDWPVLSVRKQRAAFILSLGITAYVIFSDAAGSYYYAIKMPHDFEFEQWIMPELWVIPSGIIAGITAIGLIFGEGLETFKALREIMSSDKVKYYNRLSSWVSPINGVVFGVFGAANDAINGFVTISTIFNMKSTAQLSGLGASNILNAIADYSLNGRYIRDSINSFIEYLPKNYNNPKKVISFLVAAAASGLISYAWKGVTSLFLQQTLDDFNINSPEYTDPLVEILTWGGAGSNFLSNTASIYPLSKVLVNKTEKILSGIYNAVANRLCTATTQEKTHGTDEISSLLANQEEETAGWVDEPAPYNGPTLIINANDLAPAAKTAAQPAEAYRPYSNNNSHLSFNHFPKINADKKIVEEKAAKYSHRSCNIV